jgi:hypothetical protein
MALIQPIRRYLPSLSAASTVPSVSSLNRTRSRKPGSASTLVRRHDAPGRTGDSSSLSACDPASPCSRRSRPTSARPSRRRRSAPRRCCRADSTICGAKTSRRGASRTWPAPSPRSRNCRRCMRQKEILETIGFSTLPDTLGDVCIRAAEGEMEGAKRLIDASHASTRRFALHREPSDALGSKSRPRGEADQPTTLHRRRFFLS